MKYMGGKSRVSKYIVPIVQYYINRFGADEYIEPFVGGANIIDKISIPGRRGSDINRYLIALLSYVQHGGELPKSISFKQYSEVRENRAAFPDWYVGCVGFLASYNGRFFDGGYSGVICTKDGIIRDYYAEGSRNLKAQALKFEPIEFCCKDYRAYSETSLPKNSVIYCDPPYAGTKQYSHGGRFDSKEFWGVMREWSRKNIVLISENDAPDDFKCIWERPILRTIDNTKRVQAVEKLFIFGEIS